MESAKKYEMKKSLLEKKYFKKKKECIQLIKLTKRKKNSNKCLHESKGITVIDQGGKV